MGDGLYADTPEWQSALAEAKPGLLAEATIADAYPGLNELAVVAGGRHSRFIPPSEVAGNDAKYGPGSTFPVPAAHTDDGITVISLPAFNGGANTEALDTYVRTGIAAVHDAVAVTTCGWVIDLRTNGGGDAWAMLAVVAPLLDDGDVIGFRNRDDDTSWVTISDGDVVTDLGTGQSEREAGFSVHQPAVLLTSTATASAAEVVVVAFAGQPDVVRVGTETAGLTSSNTVVPMRDGASLVLTTAYFVDRDDNVYDGPIPADVAAPASGNPSALELARQQLRSRCT